MYELQYKYFFDEGWICLKRFSDLKEAIKHAEEQVEFFSGNLDLRVVTIRVEWGHTPVL